MIPTRCPICHHCMEVPEHYAGKSVNCSSCQRPFSALPYWAPKPYITPPPHRIPTPVPAPSPKQGKRGPKPPGYEKWTWEEIRAGHKFSKTERRWRKVGKSLGATEGEAGRLVPPQGPEATPYWLIMGGFLLLFIIAAVFFPNGCQGHR